MASNKYIHIALFLSVPAKNTVCISDYIDISVCRDKVTCEYRRQNLT